LRQEGDHRVMPTAIEDALARYPREILTRTPTPLDRLPHAGARLELDLHLKRDDLTDLALGGDKPRKLEYEVAKARASGATVLVTCGSAQSNHARLTTAAARRVGLNAAVVLSRDDRRVFQGNLLTVYLMGARVTFAHTDEHWDLERHAHALCDALRADGETPYYIPVSGSTPLSCLGYVQAGLELADQIADAGLQPAAVYTPFGTGGIFAGTLSALRVRGIGCPVIGISVNRGTDRCRESLDTWWPAIGELLDLDPARPRGPIEIHDRFVGRGYGDATEECLDAILLMAETEGILLDPVYSGKVFAGLCAHQRERRWRSDQPVVMLHSGGTPALFAYHAEIRAHLMKRGVELSGVL
jgi:1-aminocyclopropane-1-carboxylate deaminase/D-cysteine desulfhydrase-like pyridoxal-dependent ACC family enzyme